MMDRIHWGENMCGITGWGMTWIGRLCMILFWVLVLIGMVYLFKWIAESTRKNAREETPMEILKKRYAKGEISKDEFDKIKDDLSKS
jgi:putative membrane protein